MVPWLPCLICLSAQQDEAGGVLGETMVWQIGTPPHPSSGWDFQKQEGADRCGSP